MCAMAFEIRTRYGHAETIEDPAKAPAVIERLIRELETEEFEVPDDEHTEVSVGYGDWGLSVQISGLLTLSDVQGTLGVGSGRPSGQGFLRAMSRMQVLDLLVKMAEGRIQEVRNAGWVPYDRLPPHRADFFRKPSW